jgi:hypothetical protein
MSFFKNKETVNPEVLRKNQMRIFFSTRATVDIEYKGKTARFYGDLGEVGFRALANSAKWMSPVRDAPVSDSERDEIMIAVSEYYGKTKDRVFFVDDDDNELKFDISNTDTPEKEIRHFKLSDIIRNLINNKPLEETELEETELQLNLETLEKELERLGIPPNAYSLTGGLRNYRYCIVFNNDKWEVYFSNCGQRDDLKIFEDESAACECLLNRAKKEFY